MGWTGVRRRRKDEGVGGGGPPDGGGQRGWTSKKGHGGESTSRGMANRILRDAQRGQQTYLGGQEKDQVQKEVWEKAEESRQ